MIINPIREAFLAFTQAQINSWKDALSEIVARGAVWVEIDGRRVRYQDPAKLKKLIDEAQAELNAETYGGAIPVKFVETSG